MEESLQANLIGRMAAHTASAQISPQHLTPAATAPAIRPVLLRLPDVQARAGLGKSMIYALMARGEFPACVKIGPRVSAWLESDVDAWVLARVAASRGGEQ